MGGREDERGRKGGRCKPSSVITPSLSPLYNLKLSFSNISKASAVIGLVIASALVYQGREEN